MLVNWVSFVFVCFQNKENREPRILLTQVINNIQQRVQGKILQVNRVMKKQIFFAWQLFQNVQLFIQMRLHLICNALKLGMF